MDRLWDYVFNPNSIAVVGVSPRPDSLSTPAVLKPLITCGYKGKIYPVNPNASEILGLTTYPSLEKIPGNVDYVICALPPRFIPLLIQQCTVKGVKVAHIFTAGFSESGEEGRKLEKELVRLAQQSGLRLIGPNCMGIYSPKRGLSFAANFPKDSGSVALLSQSGGNAREVISMAALRNIRFSKAASYGNAADLNECDFLEYFKEDDETKVIMIYIEAPREGRRFFSLAKETVKTKPVIIIKGGRGMAGQRAILSHTGKLSGTDSVWNAFCAQTGTIRVATEEEMVDLAVAFTCLPPGLTRTRTCILGLGGGANVLASDECEASGIEVPELPTDAKERLKQLIPLTWPSLNNPIEPPQAHVMFNPKRITDIITELVKSRTYDSMILQLPAYTGYEEGDTTEAEPIWRIVDAVIDTKRALGVPITLVWHRRGCSEITLSNLQAKCLAVGIPSYTSAFRAANAINKVSAYYARKNVDD